jgi:hypothetical protein
MSSSGVWSCVDLASTYVSEERIASTFRVEKSARLPSSLQPPAHAGSSLADFSTLKMEAIRSSETSVNARSTQRHIPEDGILHSHRCGSLKSYNTHKVLRRHVEYTRRKYTKCF